MSRRYVVAIDEAYYRIEYHRRQAVDIIRQRYGPIRRWRFRRPDRDDLKWCNSRAVIIEAWPEQ